MVLVSGRLSEPCYCSVDAIPSAARYVVFFADKVIEADESDYEEDRAADIKPKEPFQFVARPTDSLQGALGEAILADGADRAIVSFATFSSVSAGSLRACFFHVALLNFVTIKGVSPIPIIDEQGFECQADLRAVDIMSVEADDWIFTVLTFP